MDQERGQLIKVNKRILSRQQAKWGLSHSNHVHFKEERPTHLVGSDILWGALVASKLGLPLLLQAQTHRAQQVPGGPEVWRDR